MDMTHITSTYSYPSHIPAMLMHGWALSGCEDGSLAMFTGHLVHRCLDGWMDTWVSECVDG
eukprot:4473406-Prorocentrum_lima.AAC.1